MRKILCGLFALLAATVPAWSFDDPKALLDAVYASYGEGKTPMPVESYYSSRLKAIEAKHLERQAVTPQGETLDPAAPQTGDFDPMIDGTTPVLLDLAINPPVIVGDRALAVVSFRTFGQESLLSVALVKEADGWKVDDVAGLGADEHWLLSWLLQYDPFAMN